MRTPLAIAAVRLLSITIAILSNCRRMSSPVSAVDPERTRTIRIDPDHLMTLGNIKVVLQREPRIVLASGFTNKGEAIWFTDGDKDAFSQYI
jgi:hypothetical protein